MFLDSGLTTEFLPQTPVSRPVKPELTLLWVGSMLPIKALPLALEAIAQTRDLPLRLLVAGDGPLMQKWRSEARTLGVDRQVVFLGRVPWQQMPELYREADVFIFTSLRDSFGTQVLEAMAHALPILTLNHQGVGTFVPDDAGIKVPVRSPRDTVEGLARGIRLLAASPETRAEMGRKGWEFARTQTWERRARKMSCWYQEIIESRQMAESHLEQECHAE
jgi:glycosyltransferase involved in cell wall biosynthesis